MLYDITPPVSPRLQVWPGDTPASREVLMDMGKGDNLTLSTLKATVHLGAHADAPSHYGADAPSIEQRDLEPYLGRCQVVRVNAERGCRMGPEHLPIPLLAPRLLFATGSYRQESDHFDEHFAAFEPALIDAFAAAGGRLIGLDTPSVDLFHSKELPSHARCLAHDLSILEGVVLEGVPDGVYELVALPLRLVGFDASPVRAVLRSLP